MIKIELTEVFGWESAIRGMRNPLNSWDKSDSTFLPVYTNKPSIPEIGYNDLSLMKKLSKAGNDHSKFLRMINVTCDITAPLYWWKEYDTYKVGTVANSCSTMHKIHAKEFVMEDFSIDEDLPIWRAIIEELNYAREKYLETKDKKYWKRMIQILPTSYNQKRTVQLNYQVLKNIYFARRNHKLDEWHTLCAWIESLPYFKEICIDGIE